MDEQEIPKTYNPKDWENKLYSDWEARGLFNPDGSDSSSRYSNILPPPNANGELHLGHASGYTVMDLYGRFERMKGKQVLLLPGKDHAGIQTQVVFEKKLQAEQGITRHDLGREKFYQSTYDFCLDRADYMRLQEKRIGLSADWSREKFTLDPEVSRRVTATFVEMYRDGMIYRGERIINWCPRCATALSDVEVIHKETEGKLYYIEYPIKDSDEKIMVATTRPETMLGDTAVAVHPSDERYQALVGKTVILPLTDREIPIIADHRIDLTFGTGAVKITPAHDPLDWEIGKTHALPTLQVIDTGATITEIGGIFSGLAVSEARVKVLEALAIAGRLIKEEAHAINLSICERCKTPIEPLISKQWFIDVDAPHYSLKQKSIEALKADTISFHPENMKEQMIQWLENLHDWCISRQLWWGHRIPVWYRGEETYCGIEAPEGDGWIQDSDTLDTWFSSGQWPYTTLGYPEAADAEAFYPTDLMVMGRDLLFFWATRMIMFGFYKTGQAPFKHLYFTGLVRDKDGLKMSKSKGNGVDVLEMIDRFGADAVRMSLTLGTTPGLDFRLYEEKIETFRNFTNKLWNMGRYIGSQTAADNRPSAAPEAKTDADRWILSRAQAVTTEVTRLLENYQLSLAGEKLRDFTWSEFADWYVEIHKVEKNDAVLRSVFDTILHLWHPFMPFVTEAIYRTLSPASGHSLAASAWPQQISADTDTDAADRFVSLIGLIQSIRALRATYRIDAARTIVLDAEGSSLETILASEAVFKRLARVETIRPGEAGASSSRAHVQSGNLHAWVDLTDIVNFDAERSRLDQELADKTRYITSLETRLADPNFSSRAPEHILAQTRTLLDEAKAAAEHIRSALAELG